MEFWTGLHIFALSDIYYIMLHYINTTTMDTTINTHNAKEYWNLVARNEEEVAAEQNTDDLSTDNEDDEWWEKAYMAEPVEPYTMEEIYAMIAQGEKDIAEGRFMEASEMMRKLRNKHASKAATKETMNYEMAMAV